VKKQNKIKVLHIFNELNYSGAEIMINSASEIFSLNSIETVILSTGDDVGPFKCKLLESEFQIFHIPFSRNIFFLIKLYFLFKKLKIDVLHIHTERYFFFYLIIAKISRVKTVIRSIHSNFNFSGCLKLRRLILLKISSLLGCIFISICDSVCINEKVNFKLNTVLINNWIDTEYYKNEIAKKVNNDKLTFVSVGSCSQVKQHFKIFELLLELKNNDIDFNYFHLGDGPLEVEEKATVTNYGLSSNVHFLGNVENVRDYLAASDYFIMPSIYEGLSIACLEAMAMGVIPIVNNAPGLIDLIEDQTDGLIFNFDNFKEIRIALVDLMKNKKGFINLKKNAVKKVTNSFSLNNVKDLILIYRGEK
jgi:glycosyltransferase involved in cell wall biosynthesis